MNERGWRIVTELRAVASELHATPAEVALAWVMAKPEVLTGPIASATSGDQVRELMRAAELRLDAAAVARLDNVSS